ncbi:hypothetical protein CVV26_03055 [Candidatus Kuenenbacteria bacterium HGW-Kuenenbacteria-1]|uniref:Uncharacterized protein n=1 Tax=Candidatus Kuenenbacteria bacterium HGW-Kuenenbacteria-1 TaxID=2013812 RepID=A0A2N1UMT4_9BACT|nr:MAG: hypothetical protein CVV26_03055 [Candidatus Kuenenbacteria bacterium HGW-Kuenenbacteria-1]
MVQENHSYNVPCIAAIDIKRINPAYKEWLAKYID